MRERDACGSRDCGQRRHAWHHLERNVRLRQPERFLAASSEHERVASFQPNDLETLGGEIDEESADLFLVEALARNRQRVCGSFGHELGSHEPVVDERVATADELQPARGDQTRVAGACPDEPDGQERASATSCSKYDLRS